MVDIVVSCRQYEDWILICRTQLPANGESILAGQSEIEDDQIRDVAQYLGHDLIAAIADGNAKSVVLQITADQFGQPQIILYQDDQRCDCCVHNDLRMMRRSVEYIPGLSALVPVVNRCSDDAQCFGCKNV